MRLPFPTRISIQKVLVFAAAVFVIQQLQHTSIIFSALFFGFVMLTGLAFNYAGGCSRASGMYVLWFALLTCIVGVLWKIVLGEPADSNLVSPAGTMSTYVVSMMGIFVSLFISRRFVRNPRGLAAIVHADGVNLGLAALGCLLVNELTVVANTFLAGGNGSLLSILNQINQFLPLAILLGTVYTIQISGGRKCVNLVTVVSGALIFIYGGLIYYSKQGMFTPIVCWAAAAASQRYRLRQWQIALLLGFAVYSVVILAPLSEVARALIPEDASTLQRAELSVTLLTHPQVLRADYQSEVAPGGNYQIGASGFAQGYFNSPQGLLDRLTMIQTDDRLVTFTLRGNKDGYQRFIFYFINWIPHFIFPNKDSFAPPGGGNAGNYYSHQMGALVAVNDFTTGISFSPTAEAFHMEGWLGLILLAPIVWTLLFTTVDLVCGDLRVSPFGLIAAVAFAHVAPESLLGGLILFIWTGNLAIIVAIVFCAYFAPVLGTLLAGPPDSRSALANTTSLPISSA